VIRKTFIKDMSCIGCGSTGPMSQRPMANNSKICMSCAEKVDDAWQITRDMWQLSGLGKKVSADDPLFQDPPPKEDCPICMLPMPHNSGICDVHTQYQSCCGKMICIGCAYAANEEMKKGNLKRVCAFCRVPCPRSGKLGPFDIEYWDTFPYHHYSELTFYFLR